MSIITHITVPTNTHTPPGFALPRITIQPQQELGQLPQEPQCTPPWRGPQQELQSLVTPHPQLESMSGCTAYLGHDETDSESETQAASMKKRPPWQAELRTKTRAIKDRDPPISDEEITVIPRGSVSKDVKLKKRRRIRSDESTDSGSKTSGTQQEDILPPLTTPIRHGTHSRPTQSTHFSRISSTPCPTPDLPHLP